MTDHAPGPSRPGETALLAVVREAEPLVGRWRERFDSSAAAGVPAHVTVLVPFLDNARVDDSVIDELRVLLGEQGPFTVRFDRIRRFPEVLYLAPAPDGPFRALTDAVAARWPEVPPYGGQFAEVVPHLTVAHGQRADVLQEVEDTLTARLPVTATVTSVTLFVSDGDRWRPRADFPLGARNPGAAQPSAG